MKASSQQQYEATLLIDGFSLTLPPYTHVYLIIHILIKLLDLSNAFLVEYLLTAMPDISTSVLKQKKYI